MSKAARTTDEDVKTMSTLGCLFRTRPTSDSHQPPAHRKTRLWFEGRAMLPTKWFEESLLRRFNNYDAMATSFSGVEDSSFDFDRIGDGPSVDVLLANFFSVCHMPYAKTPVVARCSTT